MTPFMRTVNRFAVAFQAASALFLAVCYAVHPDPFLPKAAAWCVMFGVYSTGLLRKDAKARRASKVEVQA